MAGSVSLRWGPYGPASAKSRSDSQLDRHDHVWWQSRGIVGQVLPQARQAFPESAAGADPAGDGQAGEMQPPALVRGQADALARVENGRPDQGIDRQRRDYVQPQQKAVGPAFTPEVGDAPRALHARRTPAKWHVPSSPPIRPPAPGGRRPDVKESPSNQHQSALYILTLRLYGGKVATVQVIR